MGQRQRRVVQHDDIADAFAAVIDIDEVTGPPA
jgi:hypothetical protein